ncbi:MAG: hypothetical protein BKP49_10265 [Treponema sp. CETP13]|nr:MAG: hypothetical protein BKP49_10265 [Treponema sp. CETP13]
MKKKFVLFTVLLFFAMSMYAKESSTENETPKFETSVNLLGLFSGRYGGKVEMPVTPSGNFSLAFLGSYFNRSILGVTTSGYDLFLNARIYPAKQMKEIYFGVEGGYSAFTYDEFTDDEYVSSIPLMALVGYKWVINKVALDLGFAGGKKFYLGEMDSDTSDVLNSFPFNFSYDLFFLVGYQF